MINSKLPNVGTTIFSVMSKLASEHGAINLGQGFPGFSMDMRLADLVHQAMRDGHNQYAPMPGYLPLRQTIAEKMLRAYGASFDPEQEITITAGATQAIFTAITAIVGDGDEVILFAPAYDCYAPAVELNGGKCVWVNLEYPDYSINWEHVRKLVNHRTKLIIVNTPHNPTGRCMHASDMAELEKIVSGNDILVLSDEVYEHMVFDGLRHESLARYPALVKKSLLVYSFGKTFHTTGWKMGYICGPETLMQEFRKVHQFNVFACNTPIQHALNIYMQDEDHYLQLSQFFQLKRDLFLGMISQSRFSILPSQGTYFQVLGYEGMSDERDVDFAVRLTREFGIASIPCSVFYPDRLDAKALRFCFAKDEVTLIKAAEILCRI